MPPLRLRLTGGDFEPRGDWYWRVLYRRERERGLDFLEDLFSPGTLTATLPPGGSVTLIVSTEAAAEIEPDPEVAWRLEWRRRGEIEQRGGFPEGDVLGRSLTLAADACIVGAPASPLAPSPRRAVSLAITGSRESVRDTLIALPGMTCHRAAGGGEGHIDRADRRPPRRSAAGAVWRGRWPARLCLGDTTLWLFVALRAYLLATGEPALLGRGVAGAGGEASTPTAGRRLRYRGRSRDGLLRADETGVQ